MSLGRVQSNHGGVREIRATSYPGYGAPQNATYWNQIQSHDVDIYVLFKLPNVKKLNILLANFMSSSVALTNLQKCRSMEQKWRSGLLVKR